MSDSVFQGTRQDLSGPAAKEVLEKLGCEVLGVHVVPDDVEIIHSELLQIVGSSDVDVIVTTGGTGLAPRDVTPEATARVVEKTVPGIVELMRQEGIKKNPKAALSRAIAGVRGKTLIINLPGSVRGVRESLDAISTILNHALEVISGNTIRCGG